MKDPHKAFRMAVFNALDGNLLDLDGSAVQIWDEKAEDETNNLYVLLKTETRQQIPTFSGFLHDSTIMLEIAYRTLDTTSKDEADNVSDQITRILLPTPSSDGLVQQTGFQINCLTVETVNSEDLRLSSARSNTAKFMRLAAKISQT